MSEMPNIKFQRPGPAMPDKRTDYCPQLMQCVRHRADDVQNSRRPIQEAQMRATGGLDRKPLIVRPHQGRKYAMGRMRAVCFADGEQTASRYSISEWWLEPRTRGPGSHAHADDHIFYVLAGTLHLDIDGKHTDAQRGSHVLIPGVVPHDFENHGRDECGFISINVPAGFEQIMPRLVKWFGENPLRRTDDAKQQHAADGTAC